MSSRKLLMSKHPVTRVSHTKRVYSTANKHVDVYTLLHSTALILSTAAWLILARALQTQSHCHINTALVDTLYDSAAYVVAVFVIWTR